MAGSRTVSVTEARWVALDSLHVPRRLVGSRAQNVGPRQDPEVAVVVGRVFGHGRPGAGDGDLNAVVDVAVGPVPGDGVVERSPDAAEAVAARVVLRDRVLVGRVDAVENVAVHGVVRDDVVVQDGDARTPVPMDGILRDGVAVGTIDAEVSVAAGGVLD